MAILEQSLKNPQAVGAVLVIAMLFGGQSLFRFPVQLLPDIDRPQLSISTNWRTASSREVESEVIEPQEDVLSGLPGMVSMRSSAFNASGFINLEFEFGTNMQETLVEIISRLNRVQGFPDNADPPVVELGMNNTLGSGKALSWFYVQLQPHNKGNIDDYVPLIEDVVRPKLESVPGVASLYMSAGEVDELRVDRQPGANVLAALNRVKAVFAQLDETVLQKNGLTVDQSFDPTVFIHRAIALVTSNIVVGALLALGVLWWFLRNVRATLIIALAIPCSLLITSLLLYTSGRTLNIISLAGVAFAVGMVLDAAIVVLENIVRLKARHDPERAATLGTTQV